MAYNVFFSRRFWVKERPVTHKKISGQKVQPLLFIGVWLGKPLSIKGRREGKPKTSYSG